MKPTLIKLVMMGAIAAVMATAQTTTPATPAAPAPETAQKGHAQKQLMQELALTKKQKLQAKAIRQTTKQQAEPLTQQVKEERQVLSAAVQAGDTPKIQQASTQLGSLQGQVLAVKSEGKAQFLALLTPEQKAKAVEFEKSHQTAHEKGE
jgi:Spy/CpxP family protein refolding chaperone